MASSWGDVVWPADGNGHWQVGVSAVVVSQDDDFVTYMVTCDYRTWWGYQVHSTWWLWADDGAAQGNHLDASDAYEMACAYGQQVAVANRWVRFERRAADYTAWFCASFSQHGGYGDGQGMAKLALTVPARPKYPPNPPSIDGAGRDAAGGVTLSISLGGSSASAMEVARQASGSGAWATVHAGAPATSYSETPEAGSWRWRARLGNADGWSAWSAPTAWLSAACAPAAPTLASPAQGATVDAAAQPALAWRHNPRDGSAQAKAEARFSTDGGATWASQAVTGGASSLTRRFAAGDDVDWDVRTAGVSGEWGPRSARGRFRVRSRPKVAVAVGTVRALPFEVSWSVEDAAGSQAAADVSVLDASGAVLWSAAAGPSARSVEVPASGFTPKEGAGYTARVAVRSTTGLFGTGGASFTAAYDPPSPPYAEVTVDAQSGSVAVTVSAVAGAVDTASMAVFRGDVPIASGLSTGIACIDHLPPLDEALEYRAVAYAPSGAASESTVAVIVPSGGFAVLNYGDSWERCARMAMNLRAEERVEREVQTILTPGSDLPATAYGRHSSATGTLASDVWWMEDLSADGSTAMMEAFRGLAAWRGDAALRLPRGERRRVRASVSMSRGDAWNVAGVTVDWEEVAGGLDR